MFIVVITTLLLVFHIDVLPISIMEARNFITAREMIDDGNWLLTTMNGEARYEKPPLPTWITALFGLIFGLEKLWALRLPAILMFGLSSYGIFAISKQLVNNFNLALLNSVITITSFYILAIIFEAPWDIYTHGFMIIGILFLLKHFLHKNNLYLFIASFFIGCSILSKGPISIYALLLPFLIAYGIVYKYKFSKPVVLKIIGVVILSLLIGGWWFLYVRMVDPDTFLKITEKETGNWNSYNVRPFYYYWSFFANSGLWLIPAFVSLLYPYLKNKVSNLKAYQFSLIWVLASLVLLSLVPEKKSRYLVPTLIPLAMNCGFYMEYVIKHFKYFKLKEKIAPVFHFSILIIVALAIPAVLLFQFKEVIFADWFYSTLLIFSALASGTTMMWFLKKRDVKNLTIASVAFYGSILFFGMPLVKHLPKHNYTPITDLKEEINFSNINLFNLNEVSPEIIWQYGDKIPEIDIDELASISQHKELAILVTNLEDSQQAFLEQNFEIIRLKTYDLNWSKVGSKGHKNRLTVQLLKIKKL
ncbi:glycosyltransferase [Paucihalobacter ruber]|uniref:Glycosyltransferase n=1 Tax=Paucihalobacter ruber TaxID=2567861 RepID=A0A506PFF9_9FLAO|nr:glycosyltransferase [Paucihalobacter ruber]